MVFHWIVNIGLMALPIGTTIGILRGIESYRQATGQAPLFSGDNSGDNNSITKTQYCQKSYGISPLSNGEEYTRK
jgi:hypothetical protein